eukprot:6491991-Amphidinium_carterae.1
MAAASQYSVATSTFGSQPNWPTFVQGLIAAVCQEVGGHPGLFDVVEYLDPDREERCRLNPCNAQLAYRPVLKEGDQVTIGCRAIHYASSALSPINNANERVLQIIPSDAFDSAQENQPFSMRRCIVPPLMENNDWMTWHDKGAGTHNPEARLAPALAYHSGTLMTVLSILRCKKYAPKCNGNAIYAGRTYAAVKDFHDFGAVNQQAAHYHSFPVGSVKVIQQLLVSKTNVCSQHHAGCVAASINHLGVYALLVPVEAMVGKAAAATHQVAWVEDLAIQDVISMCNVRETMNVHYASQGRQPHFPFQANPDFNPDMDFGYNDHGQPLEPNAQQALSQQSGAPNIIRIGEPNAIVQQQPQLTQQAVQAWNQPQTQPQPQPSVQMQPTPFISASSAPMQSMQVSPMPNQVQQPPVQQQPQLQQRPTIGQIAQTMRELRQPAPTFQSTNAASSNPYNFDAMWQRLLPGRFASLIPMFRNDRRQRDIREIEDQIPKVRAFLEAWENVPQNRQPR